ncbi:MAG: MlaD family protein, partial [Kiritimatiellaeota bacterium]|nr:MlaD family protein [Kiritimatiellota bacterium]
MSNKSELRIEFFVGFFVALVLAGLAFFTIIVSGATFFRDKKFKIEIVMPDAMGLRRNDFVIAKGTSVGSVDKVFYDHDGVHVTAVLDAPVVFYEDYTVTVVSSSILGGRQLVIHEGNPENAVVKNLIRKNPTF